MQSSLVWPDADFFLQSCLTEGKLPNYIRTDGRLKMPTVVTAGYSCPFESVQMRQV